MKKLLTAIFISLFLITPAFILAQDETAAPEETADILLTIEEERTQKLEEQLFLTLPLETDNPNHVITFKDPSAEAVGIKMEVDGQGFAKITSPYSLPSLGIGEHTLTFRFTDTEDTVQTLEKKLTVVPRPPTINPPTEIESNSITFTGKALAGSQVQLYLAGDTHNAFALVEVEDTGDWTYIMEEEYKATVYTLVGVTKKDGFGSAFSEAVVFEIGEDQALGIDEDSDIMFSFAALSGESLMEVAKANPDLLWYGFGALLIGITLTTILNQLVGSQETKKAAGVFRETLNKAPKSGGEKVTQEDTKNLTLREKFEKAGFDTTTVNGKDKKKKAEPRKQEDSVKKAKEEPKKEKESILSMLGGKNKKKEDVVEEKVEEETKEKPKKKAGKKTVSKEEFLEEYKDQDPDDETGIEKKATKKKSAKKKKSKDMSKNVKVDLT